VVHPIFLVAAASSRHGAPPTKVSDKNKENAFATSERETRSRSCLVLFGRPAKVAEILQNLSFFPFLETAGFT
jgi:hypothetical protein